MSYAHGMFIHQNACLNSMCIEVFDTPGTRFLYGKQLGNKRERDSHVLVNVRRRQGAYENTMHMHRMRGCCTLEDKCRKAILAYVAWNAIAIVCSLFTSLHTISLEDSVHGLHQGIWENAHALDINLARLDIQPARQAS